MENTFPSGDDVLIEILVWLPVISLLRFKAVSKSWLALIESSFFIHLHAITATVPSSSSSKNKFGDFIFQTSPQNTMETGIFMLSSSSSGKSRSGNGNGNGNGGEVFEDLGFPPFYKTSSVRGRIAMVGSCNGLICLHDDSKLWRGDVSLWNPATKQFRLLPKSITFKEEADEEEEKQICFHDVLGFGFDVKTKDYKVIKISSFFHTKVGGIVLRVQVYSLSSNSWRVLEVEEEEGDGGGGGINSLFPQPVQTLRIDKGVYLNGRSFFNGIYETEDGFRQWVLSFDFTKEIFTTIQFPNHGGGGIIPLD